MIIVLKPGSTKKDADEILGRISAVGLKPLYMPGTERIVLGAIGDERILGKLHIENHPLVEKISPVLTPYKLVSREIHPRDTIVRIGGVPVGGRNFTVIAGPCAVESPRQMLLTAQAVKRAGARCLRGGAYKPRSSPYSFQGLGLEGLQILREVSQRLHMPAVTEVVEVGDVAAVEEHAAAFQVGARNMQNFRLLKALGQSRKPVILKRGMAASVDDLLLAAEYILSEGNHNVILCERGIRTFETATRNTLDLNAIPHIKQHSHLPVIVDPSHGTGVREYVAPMAKAAVACGADGLLVEVHCNPKEALSDGHQSLDLRQFASLMKGLQPFVLAAGRRM
ncbi:MAG TPA: 3-deoxy-7-phosphoheptulonate synthase [Candidatus Methylomirabilis sp.]|nr:3-deoxy-7-phosphoheptulonate synthase [Candidatus Methylomirabilis sp.]